MANPNKQKGTRAETKVVKYLKEYGIEAKRKALTGNKDEGDIQVYDYVTLEVKAGKQTANYNRTQLNEWLRQARVEAKNSGQECYLVIVRYQRKIEDAEVWYINSPDNYRLYTMAYLSDFVELLKE